MQAETMLKLQIHEKIRKHEKQIEKLEEELKTIRVPKEDMEEYVKVSTEIINKE